MNESTDLRLRRDLQSTDQPVSFEAAEFAQRVVDARSRCMRRRRIAASCSVLTLLAVFIAWRVWPTIDEPNLITTSDVRTQSSPSQEKYEPTIVSVDEIELELAKLARQQEKLRKLSERIAQSRALLEKTELVRQQQTLTLLRAEVSREIDIPNPQ